MFEWCDNLKQNKLSTAKHNHRYTLHIELQLETNLKRFTRKHSLVGFVGQLSQPYGNIY